MVIKEKSFEYLKMLLKQNLLAAGDSLKDIKFSLLKLVEISDNFDKEDYSKADDFLVVPPTKGGIRDDPAGSGKFGAKRGHRRHTGEDYLCSEGEDVLAIISGKVTRIVYPYGDDLSFTGIEIVNKELIAHIYYFKPFKDLPGGTVLAGDIIGHAQDVTKRYPGQGMRSHIHAALWVRPSFFANMD